MLLTPTLEGEVEETYVIKGLPAKDHSEQKIQELLKNPDVQFKIKSMCKFGKQKKKKTKSKSQIPNLMVTLLLPNDRVGKTKNKRKNLLSFFSKTILRHKSSYPRLKIEGFNPYR